MISFVSSAQPPQKNREPAYFFIFSGNNLLVFEEEGEMHLPFLTHLDELPAISATHIHQLYFGVLQDKAPIHCYAVEVPQETAAPQNMAFVNLRQLFQRLSEKQLTLAGRALQIIDWERTHQYCSRCGTAADSKTNEHVKVCPQCHYTMYPRLAPAIIVRVQRETENGREILLARGPHYPPGWFSVLAGFVEPGENLETCVAREVYEEVGIRVKNIQYYGSQPWPFPHSLMLGFTADYESGDLTLQEDEIEEAHWFRADNMPRIPPRMSISRHLIDDFIEKNMPADK